MRAVRTRDPVEIVVLFKRIVILSVGKRHVVFGAVKRVDPRAFHDLERFGDDLRICASGIRLRAQTVSQRHIEILHFLRRRVSRPAEPYGFLEVPRIVREEVYRAFFALYYILRRI